MHRKLTKRIQMEADVHKPTFTNDAFISYSRKDREFAAKLEKALEEL